MSTPRRLTSSQDRWDSWLNQLPPATAHTLTQGPPAAAAATVETPYETWLTVLPDAAREALLQVPMAADATPPEAATLPVVVDNQQRYLLLECPSGEFPKLRSFRTPEKLVARLAKLAGQDVVAYIFFGVHLPFTVGPQRYLHLPDGQHLLAIPFPPGALPETVEAATVAMELQDDHFLGPPELAQTYYQPADSEEGEEGGTAAAQPD